MRKLCVGMLVIGLWACAKEEPAKTAVQEAVNLKPVAESQTLWIKGWQETSVLSGPRAGAAALAHNGFIYVIGGVDGRDFVPTVEFAQIQADGSFKAVETLSVD